MPVGIQAAGILKEHITPDLTVEASSVGEAVSQLDFRDAGEVVFLVNGRMAHWQTKLHDGDLLKLIPAIGGGAHDDGP